MLKIGSLFSGVGGLDLAVEEFFGAETAWHCEWDEEPSKVLAARWPGVPNYRDVRTVDWSAVEPVDIMCGGFPCQDVSLAGRRAGMKEGTRSGLWSEFARAIDIVRPSVVVIENVRGLLSADAGSNVEPCPWCMGDGQDEYHLRALDAVVADLSDLGFDAEWTGLRAADVGAPHGRFRFFLLAYARDFRHERPWPARNRCPRSADGYRRTDAPLTLLPTPIVADGTGGPKSIDGARFAPQLREIKQLLPTPTARDEAASGGSTASDVTLTDAVVRTEFGTRPNPRLRPTPRAARGASGTETMYRLGAERDDTGDRQGNVLLPTPMTSYSQRSAEEWLDGRPAGNGQRRSVVGDLGVLAEHVVGPQMQWGEYEPAIRVWESLTRPAPAPTLPDGKSGNHRLAAVFPEWMMGYPAGWVTDILKRNPAIKACGNGVVPQQAFVALSILWSRVLEWAVAS